MHKLVIQDDEGKTTVVPLIRDEITVGRKEGNTIRLTERNVSRRHARILRKNGTISIEDLDSYNGVRVNGTRIQGRLDLNVSDRIQIGDYLIELKADSTTPNVDPYGDQKTEPIDMIEPPTAPAPVVVPAASSSAGIPRISELVGADAETTKMPSALAYVGGTMDKDHVKALGELDGTSASASRLPKATAAVDPEQPTQELHGRLVILSANFAGQEFELSKPALVIGRTEDNDLVINHRSISRNHAKVVRENGRYTIVDLQSSNGVRVNGEEYGKVELRRGDLIDLGHVRLRFIEPGEDFLFGRDAQAVPIPSGTNKGLWIALIGVVIVGAAAVFALWRSGKEDQQSGKPPIGQEQKVPSPQVPTEDGTGPSQQGTATQNPPTNPENPQPVATDELAKALAAANQELKEKDIKAALEHAKKALSLDPKHEEANNLVKKLDRELLNEGLHAKFMAARDGEKHKEAGQIYERIDTDSVFYPEVHEAYLQLRESYLNKVEARAEEYASTGKCTQIKALRRQAALSPYPNEERKLLDEIECSTTPTNRPPPRNNGTPTPDPEEEADKNKSLDSLMSEVGDLMSKGDYGAATKKCQRAVRLRPDASQVSKCIIAACSSRNAGSAKRFYAMLSSASSDLRSGVQDICQKNQISLTQ